MPPTIAVSKALSAWGTRLTWAAQREYTAHVIRSVEVHKSAEYVLSSIMGRGGQGVVKGTDNSNVVLCGWVE